MNSRPWCCPHSIASAAVPVQKCPCCSCDDDFDAVKSSASHHRRNCMDHPVADVPPVVVAIVCYHTHTKKAHHD